MSNNPFYKNLATSFSWDKATDIGNKNIKAFNDAANSVRGGLELLAIFQIKSIQEQAERTSKFFSNFASCKTPQHTIENISKASAENARAALENSKDLLEAASKSASEAAEIIRNRFSEVLVEYSSENCIAPDEKQKKQAA